MEKTKGIIGLIAVLAMDALYVLETNNEFVTMFMMIVAIIEMVMFLRMKNLKSFSNIEFFTYSCALTFLVGLIVLLKLKQVENSYALGVSSLGMVFCTAYISYKARKKICKIAKFLIIWFIGVFLCLIMTKMFQVGEDSVLYLFILFVTMLLSVRVFIEKQD